MGSIFAAANPFEDLSEHLRRSLSQAKLNEPPAQKLFKACRDLRLNPILGAHQEDPDTWAHVGLPRERIAIMLVTFRQIDRIKRFRAEWAAHHWQYLSVLVKDVIKTPEADLGRQLMDAVKEMRKR